MSPQSQRNLAAAEKPNLIRAIIEYPKWFPPVYPVSLWVFSSLGAPIHVFNLLCFYGALFTSWIFVRTYYPRLGPAIPVVLVAVIHANYFNLHQQTSESLFLLLGVVSLLLLSWYKDRPSVVLACGLGVLNAVATLTRFFGILWIAPVALAHLTLLNTACSWRKRAIHAFVYALPTVLLVFPWLLLLYLHTGSLSGMDRFGPRRFAPKNAQWADLTGFDTNVEFVLKTTFIDLFSPCRTATHGVVDADGITESEFIVLLAVLILVALAIFALLQVFCRLPHSSQLEVVTGLLKSPRSLPLHFAVVYVIGILAAWTISNNDPVYTRFMFPSYTFIITSALAVFVWMRDHVTRVWGLLPLYLLGSIFLATNLVSIILNNSPQ